jgi:hypothetical protein
VAFVRALEQSIDRSRTGFLRHRDEFFDPYQLPASFGFRLRSNFKCDVASLVVGSVVADLLAARAEGGDGHCDAQGEVVLGVV